MLKVGRFLGYRMLGLEMCSDYNWKPWWKSLKNTQKTTLESYKIPIEMLESLSFAYKENQRWYAKDSPEISFQRYHSIYSTVIKEKWRW